MAPRFIPIPDVPISQPDESLGQKYMDAGGRILSGNPSRSAASMFSETDSSSSIGLMEQFADYTEKKVDSLRERQKLFESQYALDQAYREQEAKESDLILSDLLTDLSAYSGTQNWAGMWAKRRQILDHPLYRNSSQVKNALSQLDSGLQNFGSDYTTDGKEVSFHDVLRMAGSGSPDDQKEAFRILALRSENSLGFLNSLPPEYFSSKDPTFRFQLRTFVKENPRITEEDVERYRSLENEYVNSIKQQFSSDPVLVAKMLSSDEVQDQLKDMRSSLFYGQKGSLTDWLPRVNKHDFAIRDDDLVDLGEAMRAQVTQNRLGFLEGVGKAAAGIFTVDSAEEAQNEILNNPRLSALVAQNLLPADTSNSAVVEFVKNHPVLSSYAGLFAGVEGTGAAWKLLTKITKKEVVKRGGKKAAAAAAAKGGGFLGRLGPWAGWAAVAFAADDAFTTFTDRPARRRADAQINSSIQSLVASRNQLVSSLSSNSNAEVSVRQVTQMLDAIDRFNQVSLAHQLGYSMDPSMLFGKRQWQAVRSRLMSAPGGMQVFGSSGVMDRPGFSGPGYGAEGLTSQGNLGPGTPYGLSGPGQGSTLPNVNAMTGGVSPAPVAGGGALPGTLAK